MASPARDHVTDASKKVQTATIQGWHPEYRLNGGHKHWATVHRLKRDDARQAFYAAKMAGWERIEGRARLTVVLSYPRGVLPDQDNLTACVKGCVDGLKGPDGYFQDDSPKWLELVVRAVRGPKGTEMTLEPVRVYG